MEILVDFFNFLSEMAEKQPVVLVLIIIIIIAVGWILLIRKTSNSDGYDHKEKTGLLELTAQALAEQKEHRTVLKEQLALHEKHQHERIAAHKENTEAVREQNKSFKEFHTSLGETLDLSHRETINRLGGIESMILEVKESIKTFPENEKKLNKIIEILEQMKESENVA